MRNSQILRRASLWAAAAALAMGGAFAPLPAAAQNVELGKQVWLSRVNCRDCHGWAAHGVQDDPQAAGAPNLRISTLTREDIAETIRCGRPGTEMPYFNRFSYTDDRCYGLTAEALGADTPELGMAHLSDRAVNALVDLIQDFQARGEKPTYEECLEFWGPDATLCNRLLDN